MLRTISKTRFANGLIKSQVQSKLVNTRVCFTPIIQKKFNSTLRSEPKEVFTKVNDQSDPQRNKFFQYTWGSWMKNDKIERAKRQTKFSIEGFAKLLQDLNTVRKDSAHIDKSGEPFIKDPITIKDGSIVLSHNLTSRLVGDVTESDESILVKSIASIHEGKHHRIYKATLSTGKELVLRIPYKLESDYSIASKIKSEVATVDFLDLKLGLNVPKVLAYGDSRSNSLESPFILSEYIEGDLLMKQWDPLVDDETTSAIDNLKEVINPIIEFNDKVLSVVFNKFGSLYFYNDVSHEHQSTKPYNDESSPILKNRWRIGPSTEKSFSKNKNKLSKKQIEQYNGPWDSDKPLDLVKSIANIELENLKNRLALVQTDSSNRVEDIENLKKQVETFEHLQTMSDKLINPNSKAIMNVEELFKPRLYIPDLDPLNTIVNSKKDNKPYFVDFEYSTIKPFALHSYPSFVAYQGAKIYNLEEDIEGYKEMDDVEKQQYQFMYKKTRNERLWESALNEKRHDLIAVASPHLKVLQLPYSQALELKTPKDYLYVEGSIIQLQTMWEAYVSNGICNSSDADFPIKYDVEFLDDHQKQLEDYQLEIVSTPFAATGGWIPQDMFKTLKEQGIIVETAQGDYKVETEAALRDEPKSD